MELTDLIRVIVTTKISRRAELGELLDIRGQLLVELRMLSREIEDLLLLLRRPIHIWTNEDWMDFWKEIGW